MDSRYIIHDTSQIISPALIVFREILEANVSKIIEIAGDASRLRPHCKTHKIRQVAELELSLGITKHKCATLAEAEMLASANVKDIFLAYNIVGPNLRRVVRYVQTYPDVTLSVTADHSLPITQLGQVMNDAGLSVEVLLDVDTGMHRTGIEPGERAISLYRQIADTEGLRPGGLHVYDGHIHHVSVEQRAAAVERVWEQALRLRDQLESNGWPIPRIVAGGTGTFPIYARKHDPTLELSPGTTVFHDAGYAEMFPDLEFTPAALLLTRVISRPGDNRVTCDLGYKACAADPPAGHRLTFPDLPDAKEVLQNEEHLVLETSQAHRFQPGDELLAIPRHVCPTSALHKQVYVVSRGQLRERWDVAARDRWLTL